MHARFCTTAAWFCNSPTLQVASSVTASIKTITSVANNIMTKAYHNTKHNSKSHKLR